MRLLSFSLALISLSIIVVCSASEDDFRDRRQAAPFLYHNQQQPRGQTQQRTTGAPQILQSSQFPRFQGPPPQGFRPSPTIVDETNEDEDEESDEVERNVVQFSRPVSPSPSPQPQYRTTQSGPIAQQQQIVLKTRPSQDFTPTHPPQRRLQQHVQQFQTQKYNQKELTEQEQQELIDEQKEDEPDRLTELLPLSKFNCGGKKTGYYADDGLNCEVFHYCQDNAKHSWVCPEGFLFHQVHLICMPPSSDNICSQSTQFHFVNDFLYKPINYEETQRKPNVSLRYADRYYPENYYPEEDQSEEEPQEIRRPPPQIQPHPRAQQATLRPGPAQQQFRQFAAASNTHQVFHSPEEVNIPLQNRRPIARSIHDESPPTQIQLHNSYRFQ